MAHLVLPGDLGEAAEQREAGGVLAGLVLAEAGLEKRLVVERLLLRDCFSPGTGASRRVSSMKWLERLLGLALIEEMLAHRHVRHVREDRALVVAHHRVEHREAALVLLVVHQLDRLVEQVLRLAVDVGRHAGARRFGGGSRPGPWRLRRPREQDGGDEPGRVQPR